MGSVLQTQSQADGPWGTVLADDTHCEASSVEADVTVGGAVLPLTPGQHDLADGDVVLEYGLGEVGKKTVVFGDSEIVVTVLCAGDFVEHLPLLVKEGDDFGVNGHTVRLERSGIAMVVTCDADVQIEVQETDVVHGPFELRQVCISSQNELTYRIAFA